MQEKKTGTGRPRRGDATRAHIVSIAEREFALNGINGTSLNVIVQKAGQKNVNAVHYHFGGKTGLIQAIVDKHLNPISERRQLMLAELEGRNNHSLRDLVEALVLPIYEEMNNPDGGEEFVHINAELNAQKAFSFFDAIEHPLQLTYEQQLIAMFQCKLEDRPPLLNQKRMILIVGLLYHGLSDHARMRHELEGDNPLIDDEFMLCTLIDSIVAVLSSPASMQTEALLAEKI